MKDQSQKDKLINAMLRREEWLQTIMHNKLEANPRIKNAGRDLIH